MSPPQQAQYQSLIEATSAEKRPLRSHKRWSLTIVLFFISAAMYLDRLNFSIAGRSLVREYGLTQFQLGWIISAFLLGYGLFQAPCGRLADRFGPRKALVAAVCWWALFTVLTTVVPQGIRSALWILISIRFCLGAGEAVVYPACSSFTAKWIPEAERGRANGLIFAGVGIGAAIAPPVITYNLLHFGWRFSFWVSAVIGLLLGIVWFLKARDNPVDHPDLSAEETLLILKGIGEGNTDTTRQNREIGGSGRAPRSHSIFESWNIWAITVAYFCFGYVAWLFFGWFYIYLAEERKVNLSVCAIWAMLPFIAMVVGSIIGGLSCDRLTRKFGVRLGRCATSAAAMAFAAILLVLGCRLANSGISSVVLSAGIGSLYFAQSSFWSVSVDIGGSSSGLVSGIMNMGAQVGGAVTASLTPWLATHFGWASSFSAAGVIAFLGALVWLFVNPCCSAAV